VKLVQPFFLLPLATACLSAGQGVDSPPPVKDQEPAATEELLSKPSKVYWAAKDAARKEYQLAVATALEKADKVELYLLDFEVQKEPESDFFFWENRLPKEFFPITSYKSKSKILARKLLSP
jgi:hypothetical protein